MGALSGTVAVGARINGASPVRWASTLTEFESLPVSSLFHR
jgi:hypothetical protein